MHEPSPTRTPAPNTEPGRDPKLWPLGLRVGAVLAVIAFLVVPLILWRDQIGHVFAGRDQMVAEIRAAGAWGRLLLIALAAAQTVAAPIPGQVVNFAAGYLYGLGAGLLYSWLGQVLGSALALVLARFAGRPIVERLVGSARLARLEHWAAGRGLSFFFLFFVIPGLPDDLLCFAGGLTRLPLRLLLLMSAVGRLPGLFAAVWLGAYAERLPWQAWLVSGLLALLGVWLLWRFGDRIQEVLLRIPARCGARHDGSSSP